MIFDTHSHYDDEVFDDGYVLREIGYEIKL